MAAAKLNPSVVRRIKENEYRVEASIVHPSTYAVVASQDARQSSVPFQPRITPRIVHPPWPAAPTGDDARPFEPEDAAPPAIAALDAAAPAKAGAPDFADPFHFDWPHW